MWVIKKEVNGHNYYVKFKSTDKTLVHSQIERLEGIMDNATHFFELFECDRVIKTLPGPTQYEVIAFFPQ